MKASKIQTTLNLIQEQTGIILQETGTSKRNYFNVSIPERVSEWVDFNKLNSFANKYNLIRIEPNGLKVLAIYPLN